MTTPTIRECLIAALLARGERDVTQEVARMQRKRLVFTRQWKGDRDQAGALVAVSPKNLGVGFWFVGLRALRVGRVAPARHIPVRSSTQAALVEEGRAVLEVTK